MLPHDTARVGLLLMYIGRIDEIRPLCCSWLNLVTAIQSRRPNYYCLKDLSSLSCHSIFHRKNVSSVEECSNHFHSERRAVLQVKKETQRGKCRTPQQCDSTEVFPMPLGTMPMIGFTILMPCATELFASSPGVKPEVKVHVATPRSYKGHQLPCNALYHWDRSVSVQPPLNPRCALAALRFRIYESNLL